MSGHHIKVDVAAYSDDWLGFERAARICQTTPHVTETGYTSEGFLISAVRLTLPVVLPCGSTPLTYYTKDPARLSEDRTAFDIVVRLPAPTWTSQPLLLPNVSASLYGFNILVDNMDGFVIFDSVFMRSMGKPIHIGVSHVSPFEDLDFPAD